MSMQSKFKFTKVKIKRYALPPESKAVTRNGKPIKDRIYWDTGLPGFGIRVGRPRVDPESNMELPPTRTYIAQMDIDGRT